MISRRLLRIKVLHILYAYFNSNDEGINKYEKDLFFSIEKSHDLYHLFFLLLLDVKEYAQNKIDRAKTKRVPTQEDLNPSLKFTENRIIKQLNSSNRLFKYIDEKKLNWVNHPELIKKLYQDLIDSELYAKYMESETDSYNADKEFIISFLSEFLVDNDDLYQILEESSIFWNDDIEFVLSMNIKTIQKAKSSNIDINLFQLFKNEEDKDFVKKLFRMVILNHKENADLIQSHIKNWDVDRIAQLDLLVLEMAVTEIIQFTSIPVKVSFNEYIELVKFYSTDRSNAFVNGVLDKIIHKLKEEGKVKKAGRGLME
ncbi:MAG: transcription antitermination factor NusB [Salinivirgaceae bacterium]|jgi:N utilization substance protein B|nr:transcription antitermination factor NusB [Salinivirgaceae bacterium]